MTIDCIYSEDWQDTADECADELFDKYADKYDWEDIEDIPDDMMENAIARKWKGMRGDVNKKLKPFFNSHICVYATLCIEDVGFGLYRVSSEDDPSYQDCFGMSDFITSFNDFMELVEDNQLEIFETNTGLTIFRTLDGMYIEECFAVRSLTKKGEKLVEQDSYDPDEDRCYDEIELFLDDEMSENIANELWK